MDKLSTDAVLHEARTLAMYAFRSGTLPDQSPVFTLIESISQARERGEFPPMEPLIAETHKLSKAAGITLEQLVSRETPLGRFRLVAAVTTPFLIGIMTLLLTLYMAYQSSELHKAELALREYQDLVVERPQEKIYLAWKMYTYESVLNLKGPPLVQLDGYQKLVDDAKRLYAKRAAVQLLLSKSGAIRYVPDLLLPASVGEANAAELGGLQEAADVPPLNCPKPGLQLATSRGQPKLESKVYLDEHEASVACFVQSLQIRGHDYPLDGLIYETRNTVHLLVSWLLPGLYGLLGACVFVMRDLLLVNGRNRILADARIVDLLSLLLRVALGGLAGIIIGWFWVPTTLTSTSSAVAVSSISFGVAFLAGFSIESLFSLLDRLNRTIVQHDEKKSAAAAKELEGKT